jgi:hypothetical protein
VFYFQFERAHQSAPEENYVDANKDKAVTLKNASNMLDCIQPLSLRLLSKLSRPDRVDATSLLTDKVYPGMKTPIWYQKHRFGPD